LALEQGLCVIPPLFMPMPPMPMPPMPMPLIPMPAPPIIIGFMPMPVLANIGFIPPIIVRAPETGAVVLATVLTSAYLVAALVLAAATLPFSFRTAA